jgi:NADH-quinone oxidoreductase subunit L
MLSAAYAARFHLMAFGIVKYDLITNYLPSPIEKAMPVLLAIGSLLIGGLWLGGIHSPLSEQLGGELPMSRGWETALSLLLVIIGALLGAAAARRRDLGTRGAAASVADWLGLPSLIDLSITRPVLALAGMMAKIDNHVIDAGVWSVVRLARNLSRLAATSDDRVVDGGVRMTVGLGRLLSRLGANIGETVTDGLPTLTAQLVATGGRQTVRLQSGMAHHYYALITGGIVVVVALALLGT